MPIVEREQRLALIAGLLPFAVLPVEARATLVALLREERYVPGSTIIAEGEAGETLYVIAQGRAEATRRTPAGPVSLALLGAGDLCGELALLTPGHRRQATVTALTPLLALALDAPVFDAFLDTYPLARKVFAASAEALIVATFLKGHSPFATLDAAHIQRLAAACKQTTLAPGSVIVRQGDRWGYACFLLRSGRVEVVEEGASGERLLATLGPGTLFGEVALLTDAPRTATVRALERCEVLILHRPDLLNALASDPQVGMQLRALLYGHG